jgi:hypothetical protein
MADLVKHTPEILSAFARHPQSSRSSMEWANDCMKQKYAQDVKDLSQKVNGWHFGALHTSEDQLKEFRIEDMARDMQRLAPELWDLLGLMLSADRNVGRQRKAAERAAGEAANSEADRVTVDARDDSEMYWDGLNDVIMQDDVADLEGNTLRGSQSADRNAERREALITIVRTSVQMTISFIFKFT